MFDFSDAEEQREFGGNGPVPAGSIVMVEMEVLQPKEDRRARENSYISVAQSGLRQIYCQFIVAHGTYQGVSFRQNITLPLGAQKAALSSNQEKACRIGNSTLKAICLAGRISPKVNDVTSLTGLRFPVRVKINPRPAEMNDGRVFWNNEIALVITPDKENYSTVYNGGEIITDGPVADDGNARQARGGHNNGQLPYDGTPPPDDDLVPF